MLAVTIDSREPASIQGLKFGQTPVIVTTLDSGDCRVICDDGATLIIERKTPDDFLNSIKDGRLFEQVIRMREVSPWCYLIITGPLYALPDGYIQTGNRHTGWKVESVEGAKITIQELGCAVVECKELEYPAWIERLANRDRGNVRAGAIRNGHILSPGEQVVTALPGIGLDKAQLLLECHTPARAIEFLTRTDLSTSIQGIGPKTKENIKRSLGLKETECLKVINSLTLEFLEGSPEFYSQVEVERS
jgi:DNA excision repair protein ERCC-4